MEFKSCITAGFILFLLVTPCLSRVPGVQNKEPEIYEIDYRGPETHSYLPPPNQSDGRHNIHHRNMDGHRKSKDMRVVKAGVRFFEDEIQELRASFSPKTEKKIGAYMKCLKTTLKS